MVLDHGIDTDQFDGIAGVSWEQVIDISGIDDPLDRLALTRMLDTIEGTQAGQQVLLNLLAKQESPNYAGGVYHGEKLQIISDDSVEAAYFEYPGEDRVVYFNTDIINDVAMFLPNGDVQAEPPIVILFHELAHAGDAQMERWAELTQRAEEFYAENGLRYSLFAGVFVDKPSAFLDSLSEEQITALEALQDRYGHLDSMEEIQAYSELYEETLEILLEHPEFQRLYAIEQEINALQFEIENLAMDAANILAAELGIDYVRGHYFAGTRTVPTTEDGQVITSVEQLPEQTQQLLDRLHQEWEEQYGPHTGEGQLTDENTNRVPSMEEQGLPGPDIMDVILSEDMLLSMQSWELADQQPEAQEIGELTTPQVAVAESRDISSGRIV